MKEEMRNLERRRGEMRDETFGEEENMKETRRGEKTRKEENGEGNMKEEKEDGIKVGGMRR